MMRSNVALQYGTLRPQAIHRETWTSDLDYHPAAANRGQISNLECTWSASRSGRQLLSGGTGTVNLRIRERRAGSDVSDRLAHGSTSGRQKYSNYEVNGHLTHVVDILNSLRTP